MTIFPHPQELVLTAGLVLMFEQFKTGKMTKKEVVEQLLIINRNLNENDIRRLFSVPVLELLPTM